MATLFSEISALQKKRTAARSNIATSHFHHSTSNYHVISTVFGLRSTFVPVKIEEFIRPNASLLHVGFYGHHTAVYIYMYRFTRGSSVFLSFIGSNKFTCLLPAVNVTKCTKLIFKIDILHCNSAKQLTVLYERKIK